MRLYFDKKEVLTFMKSWFVILMILFSISYVRSQSITYFDYLDSLKYVLQTTQDLPTRIQAANEIGVRYIYANPDSTIKYCEMALLLLENAQDLNTELYALGILAESYIYKGNFPKTLEICFRALDTNGDTPFETSYIGPTYYNLSELYFQIGDYDKAMYYAQEMIRIGRHHQDVDKLAEAYGYYLTAQVLEKQGIPDSALSNIELSFPIFRQYGDSFFKKVYGDDVWPGVYNLRAKAYLQKGNKDLARRDLIKVSQMTGGNNEYYHISNTHIDFALYFQNNNEPDSSIYFAEKGLKAAQTINYNQGIYRASQLLAEEYEARNPQKALDYLKLSNTTQSKLYGSGNIQAIRDIVTKEEQRREELEQAEKEYRNRLASTLLLIGMGFLFIISFILYQARRRSEASRIALAKALENLKSTQSQLVHSEKMASLGELTAGIAHEIQNPLNFVNNFSEVSKEIIEEIEEDLEISNPQDIKETISHLKNNLIKIHHHGERASDIVRSMLDHSRTKSDEKTPTDINQLCDEYLRLAYHGLRAKNKSFQANFRLEADPDLPKVMVVSQDMGRVLLNLINNGFQATLEKSKHDSTDYKPELLVKTVNLGESVQIQVIDNGPGVPKEMHDKIFQPFFTTKATGEGTGLGLSLAYDIVKAHGGDIRVHSVPGEKTTFTINLPT